MLFSHLHDLGEPVLGCQTAPILIFHLLDVLHLLKFLVLESTVAAEILVPGHRLHTLPTVLVLPKRIPCQRLPSTVLKMRGVGISLLEAASNAEALELPAGLLHFLIFHIMLLDLKEGFEDYVIFDERDSAEVAKVLLEVGLEFSEEEGVIFALEGFFI